MYARNMAAPPRHGHSLESGGGRDGGLTGGFPAPVVPGPVGGDQLCLGLYRYYHGLSGVERGTAEL